MGFNQEIGALITSNGNLIYIVRGTAGSVDFPSDMIWDIHKRAPGYIYALAHTHPPFMTELSSIDEGLLKSWTFAMHPFPARVITVTLVNHYSYELQETTYLGTLESKGEWIERGKVGARKFEITLEKRRLFYGSKEWYGELLWRKSGESD